MAALIVEDARNPLQPLMLSRDQAKDGNQELLPSDLREDILRAGRLLQHPTYLHTSCALSLIWQRSDFNATFRRPHLTTKCLPSVCPVEQRERCSVQWEANQRPTPNTLSRTARFLDLPDSAVEYDERRELINVRAEMTQEDQSFLTHATGFTVRGASLVSSQEWVGSIHRTGA
jgi:hypothetical protein